MHIRSINRKKSPLKTLTEVAVCVLSNSRKFLGSIHVHRAHRAVIFVIAQTSCYRQLLEQLYSNVAAHCPALPSTFSLVYILVVTASIASKRAQRWEGGWRSDERGEVWGGGVPLPMGTPPPLPSGGGFWIGSKFCVLWRQMAYFGEFWGAKFEVFLYREPPQWDSGRFCGKFNFEQSNE